MEAPSREVTDPPVIAQRYRAGPGSLLRPVRYGSCCSTA